MWTGSRSGIRARPPPTIPPYPSSRPGGPLTSPAVNQHHGPDKTRGYGRGSSCGRKERSGGDAEMLHRIINMAARAALPLAALGMLSAAPSSAQTPTLPDYYPADYQAMGEEIGSASVRERECQYV